MTRAEADAGLAWDVLRRFTDPASARFDAVLAAAGLDPETARALRFWHREAVEGVRQYAASALPAVFLALAAAQDDVAAAADRAGRAWAEAGARVPDDSPEVIVLPDAGLAEQRRRTVAARLARIG